MTKSRFLSWVGRSQARGPGLSRLLGPTNLSPGTWPGPRPAGDEGDAVPTSTLPASSPSSTVSPRCSCMGRSYCCFCRCRRCCCCSSSSSTSPSLIGRLISSTASSGSPAPVAGCSVALHGGQPPGAADAGLGRRQPRPSSSSPSPLSAKEAEANAASLYSLRSFLGMSIPVAAPPAPDSWGRRPSVSKASRLTVWMQLRRQQGRRLRPPVSGLRCGRLEHGAIQCVDPPLDLAYSRPLLLSALGGTPGAGAHH